MNEGESERKVICLGFARYRVHDDGCLASMNESDPA